MNDIATIWQQLEPWILANAPELHRTLQAGASDADIAKLEQRLGMILPEDYKTFLTLCNGQSNQLEAYFYDGELLSVKSVELQWDIWKKLLECDAFEGINSEPDNGIRDDWWNPRWIAFTHDGGGNHLCLDLEPAEGGTVGQVITMWHDSEARELRFPSFTAWLGNVLNGVETGRIVFDREDYNALIDIEDVA